MCNTSGIISNILVGLVTGAASSYLVTVFIQRKTDKKNHDSAKNKLSSYLRHIFDELAVIQQAVFKIFCKRANCDAQMISGA